MANYSRDTFILTNALHQLLTGTAVAQPRQYVGVRVKQGVPLVDADLNEQDDIRARELQAILRFFIGAGVPANNSGYQVSAGAADNDFVIQSGLMLVDGLPVINLAPTSYLTQPTQPGLPALTTPPGTAERTDTVYLDVWDDEIPGEGAPNADARLINTLIGIETSHRIARSWQVRVLENAADLSTLATQAGHHYSVLANLVRRGGDKAVRETMIIDRRKTGITLAENLKVPVSLRRGLEVIDVQRYGQMLRGLRTSLFTRLRSNQLPYAAANAKDETLLLMSLQELMNKAHIGEVQAFSRNLDNTDALNLLKDLYQAQKSWLADLGTLGNVGNAADSFIADYTDQLDGSAPKLIKGLKTPLSHDDLLDSVIAQEDINTFLNAPVGNLPEGSVDVIYQSVVPFEALTAGSSYVFTYAVSANFTTPLASEDFQVQVTLPPTFGTFQVDKPTLTFTPPQAQATIQVTVTPAPGATNAQFDVSVFATRNAQLRSPQPPLTLNLNQTPPPATFFIYTGPRFNPDGRLEIPQNHLTRAQGRNIPFLVRNDSPADTHTYSVTVQIVPDLANTTGWSPLNPTALPNVVLNPSTTTTVNARVDGPKAPNPPAPVSTTGNIIVTAQLVQINNAPPGAPQAPVSVTVPFVVV